MDKYTYKVSSSGRVNIIGEHIDYCGGKVFPAAISLRNNVYIRENNKNIITLKWTTLKDEVSFDLDHLEDYKNLKYGAYQAGCAYILKKEGYVIKGCDMLQDCTIPFGSGLSSSAAIEVSTIASLLTISNYPLDLKKIALLAQKVEREYVGVNCGIMDQYAASNGKKDFALLLDCKNLVHEYVPFILKDYSLVILNSNKPHSLVESKYNERRKETEEALRIVKTIYPNISCLCDLSSDKLVEFEDLMSKDIYKRLVHVVTESERVALAKEALINNDLITLGQLLNKSHESLKNNYLVTGKELDTLQEASLSIKGCIGSRMTGAGFGGCVISLVNNQNLKEFEEKVKKIYKEKIGYDCSLYVPTIEDGIVVEKL